MARDCNAFRDELARQTPYFEKNFIKTYTPLDSDVVGRHKSTTWETGTSDEHFFDRQDIGYPNLNGDWGRLTSAECGADPCNVPTTGISMGTVRDSFFMENKKLKSPLWCLRKLLYGTKPGEQFRIWIDAIRKLPMMYTNDYIRVNAARRNTSSTGIQICGSAFSTFTPTTANIGGMLTTINLGGAGNLPTSQLTFDYLDYLSEGLMTLGYGDDSGLPVDMYNLITDKRAWRNLTNGKPEMKDMYAIDDFQKASPLYRIGGGIQRPFGNYAPTISKTPIRFQHIGNGVLNRVYPNVNIAGTTGTVRDKNDPYINARWGMSYMWHPKAITIASPPGGKLHDLIPSVNSGMYGKWDLVNDKATVFRYVSEDGTTCDYNNDDGTYFYWKCYLEQGFKYEQPQLIIPILHLIDGSGKDCMVDDPVCGTAPQYVDVNDSNNPELCEA